MSEKTSGLMGPAYTDADEALRRYRENPSPTPAPEKSERVIRAEVTQPDDDSDGHVIFYLEDGRFVGVPLSWSWRLLEATPEERQNFEVGTYVVRWPDVDEDLSGRGALRGTPAPRPGSRPGYAQWRKNRQTWDAPRVKQLRQRLGLSQAEMGERMGVRQATISDWENANQEPSPMACRLLDLTEQSFDAGSPAAETSA